ncbi:hypothetical protein [Actinoplanes sp. NPDC049265]|uniref:hypothetical protein n=1 Tax=Actinoplanes sp. NPDC049265 TaxID=3363902 RepID=UPI00371B7A4E
MDEKGRNRCPAALQPAFWFDVLGFARCPHAGGHHVLPDLLLFLLLLLLTEISYGDPHRTQMPRHAVP